MNFDCWQQVTGGAPVLAVFEKRATRGLAVKEGFPLLAKDERNEAHRFLLLFEEGHPSSSE
jgi:hypothetical protein